MDTCKLLSDEARYHTPTTTAVARETILAVRVRMRMILVLLLLVTFVFADNNNSNINACGAVAFVTCAETRYKRRRRRRVIVCDGSMRKVKDSGNDPKQQQQSQVLIPEENPHANPDSLSAAGRSYGQVLQGIHCLFPPQLLQERNAVSRTDGYWPYIQAGRQPPPQLTYGEFDFYFLAQLLDTVLQYYDYFGHHNDDIDNNSKNNNNDSKNNTATKKDWNNKVFVDIGSGVGRLVLAAAALHPNWKSCRGIEVLPALHQQAQQKLLACRRPLQLQLQDEKAIQIDDDRITSNETTSCSSGDNEKPSAWQVALAKFIESAKEEAESENEDTDGMPIDNSNIKIESPNKRKQEKVQYEYVLPLPAQQDDPNNSQSTIESSSSSSLTLAPVELICGSLDDPYIYLGDADCIFCFSSCMPTDVIESLAQAVGRQCRPGTIVITTDRMLPLTGYCKTDEMDERIPSGSFELELVDTMDGYGWITGGTCTAYIHKVKRSLWSPDQGPLQPKELSLEDKAFQVYKAMEKGELSDPKAFVRAVYNDMVFAGLPDRFLPKLDDDNDEKGAQ